MGQWENFRLLVHSPNAHTGQGWTKLQLWTRNKIQFLSRFNINFERLDFTHYSLQNIFPYTMYTLGQHHLTLKVNINRNLGLEVDPRFRPTHYDMEYKCSKQLFLLLCQKPATLLSFILVLIKLWLWNNDISVQLNIWIFFFWIVFL